ncbi:MAG: putative protein kinase domain protein [Streblomastix strix]|uniref:non-specific serine/threonine protein kinase n=1 Tax=Streblomastix strix TaxID=222440 RepID=A0A5J4X0P4_9EUKA|nr:MAG: putative protein kinase domain protein [Streblomastix strix]
MLDASRFIEENALGHGAFGKTGVFRDAISKKQVLIKSIQFFNESDLEASKKEASVMQTLKSEFVVKCYGYFIKEKTINIVMEYCEKGDLQKFIDNLEKEHKIISEQEFFDLASQLASGLSFIHSKQVIHRDLKPSNIFISGNNRIKIGDFGISKIMDEQDYTNQVAGTKLFLSPEMLKKWSYTEKVDQWSLGIILYILAELKYPFDTTSELNLVNSITNELPAPFVNLKNKTAQKLILLLLSEDASKRPTSDELLQIPEIASSTKRKFRIIIIDFFLNI